MTSRYTAVDSISLNTWHHVVVIYNSSSPDNEPTMYIDGAAKSITENPALTGSGTTESNAGGDFEIGGRTAGDRTFPGTIDEVRIYNRALSAKEIERLYKLGRPKIVTPDNTGLVGYWRFDEGMGTKLGDFSGNNNHGTLQNMEEVDWVDGKYGKGLDFDGSDEYVELNNYSILDLSAGNATISAWFKLNGDYTSTQYLIGDYEQVSPYNSDYLIDFGLTNNEFSWRQAGATVSVSSISLSDDNWHHIVGTRSGSAGNWNISWYLDGTFDETDNTAANPVHQSSATSIGRPGSWSSSYFNGTIDEVRIYNRALSASEIQTLYKSGLAKINTSQTKKLTDGLVGMWSFDGPDMYGNTAYDRSGQGNNGTLTNGPVRTIGKVGQALEFYGADDYVNIANNISGISPNLGTLSAWVNTNNSYASGNHYIYSGRQAWQSDNMDILLGHWNNLYSVKISLGATSELDTGYDMPKDANYHNLALTWNSGNWDLYHAGIWVASSTYDMTDWDTIYPAQIGARRGDYPTKFWNGVIDEVRVYNRVLSAEEVRRLYEMGR